MDKYLWRVLNDGSAPPKKYKLKKEKKYSFLIYADTEDGKRNVIEIMKPFSPSPFDGYSLSSIYYTDEKIANTAYIIKKLEKDERKKDRELKAKEKHMIESYPFLEAENKKLREKLLTVIDFALTICHEECRFADVCDMDSWGERNIERCALKRMKKELQEKEQ